MANSVRVRIALTLGVVLLGPIAVHALGDAKRVAFAPGAGSFPLAAGGHVAPLFLDERDYAGVLRAAQDLREDLHRVTGIAAGLPAAKPAGMVVFAGTVGHSHWIDDLVRRRKIDVSAIAGKWEASLTVVIAHPFPGVAQALVIAGSDKRGTIFALYGLSEDMGVSPWYWWADVPVKHRDALYVLPGAQVEGEPRVKYRGIFLNDEAPALSGWTKEKFGGYNHKFYEHVFELLLRLKANYLWPAMWGSAFNEDDPENPRLADEYGIVMGTSHHEPMLRAQQEWKRHGNDVWDYAKNGEVLRKFWAEGIERNKNFESTITLGMRGDGDMPMTEGQNIALLEQIVADQRKILAEHETPTLKSDLKVWALYKEVQAYYEKGMRVPDDVTLLWCDDNWGNLRRLPTPEERKRPGGAGIYYHFDYVGDPRNYKWLNTNPIAKIREQMNLALEYGADRLWVVNVGDLKPMEFPIDFVLRYARRPEALGPDSLGQYTYDWVRRQFGTKQDAEITGLIEGYTRLNGRRKPELMDADTFSQYHFGEAERVEKEWADLSEHAKAVESELPAEYRDAYFELVEYPVLASATVTEMYLAAGRNHKYAARGDVKANVEAERVRELFAEDARLSARYNHELAGGKWNHMMDQTHLGYTWWQEPPVNVMPAVSEVKAVDGPKLVVSVEGFGPHEPPVLRFDSFNDPFRKVILVNPGNVRAKYRLTSSADWLRLLGSGEVVDDVGLGVAVDWGKFPPAGHGEVVRATLRVEQAGVGVVAEIPVEAQKVSEWNRGQRSRPFGMPEGFRGYVERDGLVAIEAEHAAQMTPGERGEWVRLPGYGATLSGVTIAPGTAASVEDARKGARLDYEIFLLDAGKVEAQVTVGPTLGFVPGRGLRYAVWLDEGEPVVVDVLREQPDWAKAVSDNMRRVVTPLGEVAAGVHVLHVGMVDPGVVLERVVVSRGIVPESYLGPPESWCMPANGTCHWWAWR